MEAELTAEQIREQINDNYLTGDAMQALKILDEEITSLECQLMDAYETLDHLERSLKELALVAEYGLSE